MYGRLRRQASCLVQAAVDQRQHAQAVGRAAHLVVTLQQPRGEALDALRACRFRNGRITGRGQSHRVRCHDPDQCREHDGRRGNRARVAPHELAHAVA